MKRIGSVIVVTATVVAYACGSSNSAKKDGAIDTHVGDAPRDAVTDTRRPDAPLDGPPGTVQLTVHNYFAWCMVKVGTGTYSPASSQMVFVTPGDVTLSAEPNGAGFELGSDMWHHTTGDSGGSGEAGSQSGTGSAATSVAHATTVLGTPKCVWVCCPFAGTGSGCTGLPEQCL